MRFVATCRLPTEWGEFTMYGFEDVRCRQEHVALTVGNVSSGQAILGRIHSECLTGDALFSKRCDCGPQLEAAMKAVQAAGQGIIVYLRQEGRGIGLLNKIRAYKLQDEGLDTVEANLALDLPIDARDFNLAKYILDYLGVQSIRLMTNNPQKVATIKQMGIQVVERVPLHVGINQENEHYLLTKVSKLGHFAD
ncbi:MAG: GTP cyclohydrolase II [Snodgrassella sp.]|nr:GTP cyclohydrolase II [Snodgrassella sp.]